MRGLVRNGPREAVDRHEFAHYVLTLGREMANAKRIVCLSGLPSLQRRICFGRERLQLLGPPTAQPDRRRWAGWELVQRQPDRAHHHVDVGVCAAGRSVGDIGSRRVVGQPLLATALCQ